MSKPTKLYLTKYGIPFITSQAETQEAAQEDVSVLEKVDERPQGRPQMKDVNIAIPEPVPVPVPEEKLEPIPEPTLPEPTVPEPTVPTVPKVQKKIRRTKKRTHRETLDGLGIKWRKSWTASRLEQEISKRKV